jgi:SAM-dependent methyltransferase
MGKVSCPLCDAEHKAFTAFSGREHAQCVGCGSLERHRQQWVWLERTGTVARLAEMRVLDLAPHPAFGAALERHAAVYDSADLLPGKAKRVMDICAIQDADASFEFIACSHVLEHVPDDAQALRELFRILAPGGMALLSVPLRGETTIEDFECDVDERRRRFGQADHVRRYGWDFFDRLEAAGFRSEKVDVRTVTSEDERSRYGLTTALPWVDPEDPALWVLPLARKPAN